MNFDKDQPKTKKCTVTDIKKGKVNTALHAFSLDVVEEDDEKDEDY